MNITVTIEDSKWQLGLDDENTRMQGRPDFVPLTLSQFATASLQAKAEMQGRQYEQLVIARLGNTAEIQRRFAKLLLQPQSVRDAFAAQVDAL